MQVLQQPVNQGKGSAVKTGILRATGQYIGFMDADFKTDLSCITDALERLEAGYDVVVGSRRLPQSQIETPHKFYRRVASQLFKYGLHMTFPALRGHQDTQCGFKFFKQNIAHNLFHKLVINRFMFDAEIFFLAHRLKYQISEIPVRWASDPDTRTTLIEGIFRNPYDLFRIRFHHRNL